jgi:hypothetical protein
VPCHLVQADVQAALGEDLRGRLEDALPVPFGVTSQRTPQSAAVPRARPAVVVGALHSLNLPIKWRQSLRFMLACS